ETWLLKPAIAPSVPQCRKVFGMGRSGAVAVFGCEPPPVVFGFDRCDVAPELLKELSPNGSFAWSVRYRIRMVSLRENSLEFDQSRSCLAQRRTVAGRLRASTV